MTEIVLVVICISLYIESSLGATTVETPLAATTPTYSVDLDGNSIIVTFKHADMNVIGAIVDESYDVMYFYFGAAK